MSGRRLKMGLAYGGCTAGLILCALPGCVVLDVASFGVRLKLPVAQGAELDILAALLSGTKDKELLDRAKTVATRRMLSREAG